MLVLNRNIGESIHIGDDIRITVLGTNGNQTRIGINAPREIPVHREEIYYRNKFNQQAGEHATPGQAVVEDYNAHGMLHDSELLE